MEIRRTEQDSKSEAYESLMAAQLAEWNARLELLEKKAARAKAEAKVELMKKTDELRSLLGEAKRQAVEMERAAAGTGQQVKTEFIEAWSRLRGSIDAILTKS